MNPLHHARPTTKCARGLRLTPLMLGMACMTPALAQQLPTGFSAVAGNVALGANAPAGTMNINQASERAIAQWQSFSIGAGGTVNVAQPSRSAVLLNRVTGADASTIAGSLNANGHVYLVNPNGVLFSKGSSVSVGGLVASTLDVSNPSFMAGGKLVFERSDGNSATVVNRGSINASAGGSVALMGAQVINEGSINVARGSVGLVSARTVTVDFDGDGLMRYTIPADSKATAALVENAAGGSVTADGGRIAMLAASTAKAQVVNQGGVLRARSLESRNGEIVLGAGLGTGADNPNGMRISGTVDAGGGETGNGGRIEASAGNLLLTGASLDASGRSGGQVLTSAHRMAVDAGSSVGAGGSGQAGSVDGRWTIVSDQDITISSNPAYSQGAATPTAPADGGSTIDAGVLGRTLDRSTSVTLQSKATRTAFDDVNGYSAGNGVVFDFDAKVTKTEGRDVAFTVNSARNVVMATGSGLRSDSGAINVDFNADAGGAALAQTLPITLNGAGPRSASILLQQASIESNGGNIRFYGQDDAAGGRAVGGVAPNGDGFFANGIQIGNSLVSTCARGVASCSGGGTISLRGQGATGSLESTTVQGGVGVAVYGSTLRSGSGAITLDGRGGLGASGVRTVEFGQAGERSVIESGTGDIRITGTTRGWSAGDPVVVFGSDDGDGSADFFGGGSGVSLINTRVTTGGGIMLDGTGADLTALAGNTGFQGLLIGAASGNSGSVGASGGVLINSTDITAGPGRQVSVSGKAGGNGFTVSILPSEATEVQLDTEAASGVQVAGVFGQGRIRTEGGRIGILGRDGSDVRLSYFDDSEGGPMTLLSVASGTGRGGSIDIAGRNILLANDFEEPTANFLDASGGAGAGSISLRGSGSIAINGNAGMAADATGSRGNGGDIRVVAVGDLRSFGTYSARGGASGGNGGFVETSGRNLDLSGIRVDASAPAGTAGAWLIDPFDVTIADGAASGSLPTLPFEALANSVIQDGDINAALNGGTSVAIGTGTIDPASPLGSITFGTGVDIALTTGTKAVSFQLDASRNISGFGTQIRATSAPLDVVFNAGQSGQSGSITYNGDILTNGGSVTMTALGNGGASCAICMSGTLIDTRVGGANGNPGGNVTLTVPAPGANPGATTFSSAAINLVSTDIRSSTGNVDITGFAQSGTGVRLQGTLFVGEGRLGVIETTSGNIGITGIGAFSSNSADAPGHGVIIDQAQVGAFDGNVTVRGLRLAGGTPGTGITLQNGGRIVTSGAGNTEVTGESQGGGAGLLTTAGGTNGQGITFPDSIIAGRNVVVRANNDGSADAIVLGGSVGALETINLRPGGVDAATGAGVDRTGVPIVFMGGTNGFSISPAEAGKFFVAPTLVLGSNAHAADISVLAPVTTSRNLTLHNGGGGNINLAAPVSVPQLGLVSGGNITQSAGAAITAGTLLAQSLRGNVILADAGNNVSASTLGGSAAGRFEFVNSGPLRVGPVSVTGFDAAGNQPQIVSATSMLADTLFIRTLSGPLILDTSVGTANGADLVAATTFQNAGGGSLGGAPWRVWADTWVGETRGGLAGSGPLPNYYHCAYLGLCTVSITPNDNHFVYAQQPTVTVNIGSFARNVGVPDPTFTYTLSGLILGDTGAGISGTMGSTATLQSPSGVYPVFGTFTSAEGYAVNVVPGTLTVGSFLPQPARFVDVLREEPTTYVYDRNMGQAPICLATGPLQGDRAQQGNDVLAREWSRVRTRPNLTSCVDTERNNGCADF